MQKWGPFAAYSNPDAPANALSIKEPGGQDFYALRNSLDAADAADGAPQHTYLAVDANGVVTVATNSVDVLFPQGLSLCQIDRLSDPASAIGKVVDDSGALSIAPAPAATSVTRTQGLIQLSRAGLYDRFQAAVASAPLELQIWATTAPIWEIGNSFLGQLAASLSLTRAQIQSLFNDGAKIA